MPEYKRVRYLIPCEGYLRMAMCVSSGYTYQQTLFSMNMEGYTITEAEFDHMKALANLQVDGELEG